MQGVEPGTTICEMLTPASVKQIAMCGTSLVIHTW
jgi:hypothetical protein